MQLSSAHAQALLNIARQSIRWALSDVAVALLRDEEIRIRGRSRRERALPIQAPADHVLHQPAGCFVSLHHLTTHRLRGCVGRLEARDPVYQAVAQAAIDVLDDPRFRHSRVTRDELAVLELEISVLSPLVDASDPLDFDLQDDGIVLTCGRHSGCFLPQVARETGWNREELLDRLCVEKLGLDSRAWRDGNARLQKFSTLILGPEAFGNEIAVGRC